MPANDAHHAADAGAGVAPAKKKLDLTDVKRQPAQRPRIEVFDRVVVRLLDDSVTDEALKKDAEARTGATVVEVRRGALQIRLLRFAPTTPERTRDDQQKLVDQLKGMPGVKYAEGDRWMTPKKTGSAAGPSAPTSIDAGADAGVTP